MAFDACITTAPAFPMARIVTADSALAMYDLARTTGAAAAYEAAAHALAQALQRREAIALATGRTLSPNLPAAPSAQSASPEAAAPKRQSARRAKLPAEDLAARLSSPPRAKSAAGSFVVRWADGTETRVTGVVYHSAKPATRWAAAFQAADRLRRTRAGRQVMAAFVERGVSLPGAQVVGACLIKQWSPEWLRFLAIRPMAALVSIHDETTAEEHAPSGVAYGAGDPAEAAELEAAMIAPRKLEARQKPLERVTTPRPALSFPCIGLTPEELDGRDVGCDSDGEAITTALEERATTLRAVWIATKDDASASGEEQAAAFLDFSRAQQAFNAAQGAARHLDQACGRRWTVRRDAGGRSVSLLDGRDVFRLPASLIPALRFAA